MDLPWSVQATQCKDPVAMAITRFPWCKSDQISYLLPDLVVFVQNLIRLYLQPRHLPRSSHVIVRPVAEAVVVACWTHKERHLKHPFQMILCDLLIHLFPKWRRNQIVSKPQKIESRIRLWSRLIEVKQEFIWGKKRKKSQQRKLCDQIWMKSSELFLDNNFRGWQS